MKPRTLLKFRLMSAVFCCVLVFSAASFCRLNDDPAPKRIGLVQDWSMRHAVYARTGSMTAMLAAQRDPRAFFSWKGAALAAERARHELPGNGGMPPGGELLRGGHRRAKRMQRDWSVSLSGGSTAAAMYPAKFGFDINAVPSCGNDFVVYPVNQVPSAAHPNLVGLNNLYSGTAGGNGICNRTPSGSDNGIAATVTWSYAVNAIGGGVSTSPALSLDGAKVAFVESLAGQQPHFHVLAWKNGDGVDSTNLQNTGAPKVVNAFSGTAPAAGSGAATNLAFGASSGGPGDTLSSPFIDYGSDKSYVGDDLGNLVRIKDVFCTVDSACSSGSPPAPSIDTTWGTSGSVSVGPGSCSGTSTSKLTGPVVDVTTGNVYVGCADGKVYGFTSSGVALANPSVTVGNGSSFGGVVDPPIVDGVNGFVYAVSGSNGTDAVLVQAKTDLSSPGTATLGAAAGINVHAPAFNDAYFSSSTPANWLIYAVGVSGGSSTLYAPSFNSSRVMNTGVPANMQSFGAGISAETSPLTEFLNGSTDWLFFSLLGAGTNTASANINVFPKSPISTFTNVAAEGNGTSGIIVDNVSSQNQASSIYFSALGTNTAVKLTQAGFQ